MYNPKKNITVSRSSCLHFKVIELHTFLYRQALHKKA